MSTVREGWSTASVTEIASLHDDRRIPLNALQRSEMRGVYPYYGANGLVDHINDYRLDGEYVLLAEDGGYFDNPTRNVAYEVTGKFWVNNHAHILKPRGDIPVRFLRHALNVLDWMPHVGGTTRLKLTQAGLKQAQVPLPPLAEQRRIVAKIDSLSSKSKRAREHLDHIPRLVEKYKQAVLAAVFNAPDNRPTLLSDLVSDGPANGYSPQTSADDAGTLSLRLSATTRGILDLSAKAVKRLSETIPVGSRYWLKPGDLLIQRANSLEHLGAAAIFDGPPATYIYPDLMMRVRIADSEIRRLVWRFLNSRGGRSYFVSKATGTAGNMPKINGAVVRDMLIPVPPAERVAGVNRSIDHAFAWIERLAAETTSARKLIDRLDQAVLAKAFRGELVPQDPNDEPASVLLERIRAEREVAPRAKPRRGRAAKQS